MNQLINENLINLNLKSSTKTDVIKELAKLINEQGRVSCYDTYVDSVVEREKTFTTGIGMGVAIPHGKSDSVKIPTIAFGRCNEGIDWKSMDGEPAKMVFLLAVPNEEGENGNQHLRILAALSRKLIHEEFQNQLLNIKNENEIVELISSIL